jgi:hypothetical protein
MTSRGESFEWCGVAHGKAGKQIEWVLVIGMDGAKMGQSAQL